VKGGFTIGLLVYLAASCGIVDNAHCEAIEKPFQVAIFSPLQLREEGVGIVGLRVNILYGKNVTVKGVDIGLVNHCTGGQSLGLQYGLIGLVEGDFQGWQDNFIAISKGSFTGLQSGLYNEVGAGLGIQMGFINKAGDMTGFQLGLINLTENMHGLQVGFVNVIQRKEQLPVLPIINWRF
jgi:hypothetical protein